MPAEFAERLPDGPNMHADDDDGTADLCGEIENRMAVRDTDY